VGFGTLFALQLIARREGKECLGWLPTPTPRSEASHAERLASFRQSILFLLACVRSPRCTKACQSPHPRPPSKVGKPVPPMGTGAVATVGVCRGTALPCPTRMEAFAGRDGPLTNLHEDTRGTRRVGVHRCSSVAIHTSRVHLRFHRAQAGKPVPPSGARRLASGKACATKWGAQACKLEGLCQPGGLAGRDAGRDAPPTTSSVFICGQCLGCVYLRSSAVP